MTIGQTSEDCGNYAKMYRKSNLGKRITRTKALREEALCVCVFVCVCVCVCVCVHVCRKGSVWEFPLWLSG